MSDIHLLSRLVEAFDNSYNVLVHNHNPLEIIENEGDVVFAHDISEDINISLVARMIAFWEEQEEYERCAELKKLELKLRQHDQA